MTMTKRNNRNYEYGMIVLDTEFKQRAFDGKWERIIKTMDHDNAYSYTTESGNKVKFILEKWVTVGVYDCMMEFVD